MGVALPVDSGSLNEYPESQVPSSNLNIMDPEEPYEGDEENFDLQYTNTSMIMSMSHDESMVGEMTSLGTFSGSGPSLTSIASSTADLHASAAKVGPKSDSKMNAMTDKVTESDSDELITKCVTELAESFKEGNGIEVIDESININN